MNCTEIPLLIHVYFAICMCYVCVCVCEEREREREKESYFFSSFERKQTERYINDKKKSTEEGRDFLPAKNQNTLNLERREFRNVLFVHLNLCTISGLFV